MITENTEQWPITIAEKRLVDLDVLREEKRKWQRHLLSVRCTKLQLLFTREGTTTRGRQQIVECLWMHKKYRRHDDWEIACDNQVNNSLYDVIEELPQPPGTLPEEYNS